MKLNSKCMNGIKYAALSCLVVTAATGCGSGAASSSSSASEDTSASGAAAGAAGGALSGSGSSGSQAFIMPQGHKTLISSIQNQLNSAFNLMNDAFASTSCPTYKSTTTGTNGCTTSGSTMWLNYSGCVFAASGSATWTGTQAIIASAGSTNPSCGTFPTPAAGGTLTRQMVTAASSITPSTATIVSSFGTTATIDNSSSNLSNFNNDTIAALSGANGGYGEQVSFNSSGARSGITLAERIVVSGTLDHSITGSLTVTETAGASTRTITGSVKVYHNLLKVIGTATFNSVTHSDSCCYPNGGSISTVYSAGSNVSATTAGSKLVGNTETLTFSSTCGSVTFVSTSGVSATVTLSRCF